jgi:glucose-1-phosphate adenylyltransferase
MQEDNPLRELNEKRPLATMPFGGKFRLIDFTLSSMVNAGINDIGLLLSFQSRSVLDHIRSAKDWNLARKGDDGLFYLPAEVGDVISPEEGDIRSFYRNLLFIDRGMCRYLLLTNCNYVHNIDYDKVLHFHRQHNADVTMIYQTIKEPMDRNLVSLDMDERSRVTGINLTEHLDAGENAFVQSLLIDCGIFERSVRYAYAKGYKHFIKDVLQKNLERLRIFAYNHEGHAARIDSVETYFKANMDLLDLRNWHDLFLSDDFRIHTKIKDEAPAKYMEESHVSNSLIANGCIIEGRVENSILFRKVRVGKNACIRNSIIMQHSIIGDDAQLNCIVCDKNAIIQPEAVLSGSQDSPLCIAKHAIK